MPRYQPAAIEPKWQAYWESQRTFAAPRLALVAKYTETAETPAEARQHLSLLASTAQATIEALRGL